MGGLDKPLLLDGRNRLAAIARIGGDQEATLRAGYLLDEGTDPYAYVGSANIHRRHLTAEGKREVIAKLLKADPKTSELTDRQIARIIGCGHPLVAEVRKTNGIIFHKTERVEASGRKARGRKPGTAASPKPIAVSDVDPTEREPDPSINKSQHVQRMVDTLDPVEQFDLASNLLLSMTPARLQEIASSAFNLLPDKRRAVIAERWWGPAEKPMKFHPVNGPTAKQMSAWIEPFRSWPLHSQKGASEMTSVIRIYLSLGTSVGGPCQGDLTEEAWRERLEIEFVARSLADAP